MYKFLKTTSAIISAIFALILFILISAGHGMPEYEVSTSATLISIVAIISFLLIFVFANMGMRAGILITCFVYVFLVKVIAVDFFPYDAGEGVFQNHLVLGVIIAILSLFAKERKNKFANIN